MKDTFKGKSSYLNFDWWTHPSKGNIWLLLLYDEQEFWFLPKFTGKNSVMMTFMSLTSPELKMLHEGLALMQNMCKKNTP